MQKRLLIVMILAFISMLAVTWSASAQGPQPDAHDRAALTASPSIPDGPVAPRRPNAPAVALGQPGLSYRYVQSFGQVETPYFEDSTHVNYPYGVGADGTNVWIAEGFGLRAMKFSNTGLFGGQIGKAGFRYGAGTNIAFDFLADVAVDGGGNIWVVDQNRSTVFKFDSSFNFVSSIGTGSAVATNNGFNNPISIAFDSLGRIYVADAGNQRVQVFNSSGAYQTTIGLTGVATPSNSGFDDPEHIALDESDNLYVADSNNHRVQIFNGAHAYSETLGLTGVPTSTLAGFHFPNGVAVDAGKIYVADFNNQRVQIFDRSLGYLATLGVTGVASSTVGYFNGPADVAVDAAGNIYVSEFSKNSRVQQFDSSYNYVRTLGTTGVPYLTDGYHYNRPRGVAVATDGSVYISEERGQRVIKLNAAGVPQWTIGQVGVSSGCCNNVFNQPSDIAVDSVGRVYVADARNHRIQVYDANGAYYRTIGAGKGTGPYNFNFPIGVFVGPGDTLYVADHNNQRVQIFDSAGVYSATLGVTGVSGSDNAHFNGPADVVLDGNGTLYVSEDGNQRVQVFNAARVYQRTIGGAASCTGTDLFDEFCGASHLAVDAHNNLHLADTFPNRIQVFDPAGAYLTTIGQSFGNLSGQIRNAYGAAFDPGGNFYFADRFNGRVQKFAPGVPGWKQMNINGFGDRRNSFIYTLEPFGNNLYAGTYNNGNNGGELWRSATGSSWTAVVTNGFGNTRNSAIDHILPFNSQLYASTENDLDGGQLWRSADGLSWTQVITQGFGDSANGEIVRMAVFGSQLYASTWRYSGSQGTEIWRSATGNAGDWTRVVTNGFNATPNNQAAASSEVFNGYLYYGTFNSVTGAEVWRTADGVVWNQANTGGFGSGNMREVSGLASFGGYLYAAARGKAGFGAQVWRCQLCDGSDWVKVVDNGFGNPNSLDRPGMAVLGSNLYLAIGNSITGMEVWRTGDGTSWRQVGSAGFGDSNNIQSFRSKALAIFNNSLFIGTQNGATGTEVWQMLQQTFLPVVQR